VIKSRQIDYIFLVARGTSDNAGLYAKYLWGMRNQLPIALAAPSLFTIYKRPPLLRNALVLGISQSGQSPDIVSVVQEGKKQGAPTVTLVNRVDSPMAQAADYAIDLCAGEEKGVAATKSYSAQLMAIAMLSAALEGDAGRLDELHKTVERIRRALQLEDEIKQAAEKYRQITRCVVLGRGFNYATAFEWSLKLKELSYTQADPYSTADFLHGPQALLDEGFPVFLVAPDGEMYPEFLKLTKRLRSEFKADTLVVSNRREITVEASTSLLFDESLPEWISPMVSIAMIQLFCYHFTVTKGLDVENPRGLTKVTKTN
jgi:glucosamine--fructose-6-phosphate aminotransferase (isomerizing)